MSAIEVQGLRKRFRVSRQADHRAVDDVTFTVPEADLLVLLGASGCGKTTTLRCLAGLEQPDDGSIRFGERTVYDGATGASTPTHKRDIGLVFQTFALWPHMSAWRNIRFPLESRGTPRGERDARVQQVAELVDLDSGLLSKRPGQLSGGQQQRVAIAQAIVDDAELLLLDEPLANLDLRHQQEVVALLGELRRERRVTIMVVAHDLNPLLPVLTDAVYLLDGHPHHDPIDAVVNEQLLTHLYGTRVRVVRTPQGDLFTRGG